MKYFIFLILMTSQLANALPVCFTSNWIAPDEDINDNPVQGTLEYRYYYGDAGGPFTEIITPDRQVSECFESATGMTEHYLIACTEFGCSIESTHITAQCEAPPRAAQITVTLTCSQ